MIPLPSLLRSLRERQVDRGMRPRAERLALAAWGFAARRPRLYALLTAIAARVLRLMGGGRRSIRRLPFDPGWTQNRDFPAPEGRTFRELYRDRARARA
jgi:L-lactate dehydrogenase complex protein LldF